VTHGVPWAQFALVVNEHMIVEVEIAPKRRDPVEAPAHALLNAAISAIGAREINRQRYTSAVGKVDAAPSK